MTKNNNLVGPKNAEDQALVTVDNFIPDSGKDSVTVITSTYEDAELWGAIPVSQEIINENLGLEDSKEG